MIKINNLIDILRDKNLKIATAESCTGGLLAKKITDISGASDVFELGIVSYSNRIKNKFLDVPNDILDSVGAVSEETAREMARGIANQASSDIGVGITGFAGPTGEKVGLIFISVYIKNIDKCIVNKLMLSGTRDEIREEITEIVVEEVYNLVKEL